MVFELYCSSQSPRTKKHVSRQLILLSHPSVQSKAVLGISGILLQNFHLLFDFPMVSVAKLMFYHFCLKFEGAKHFSYMNKILTMKVFYLSMYVPYMANLCGNRELVL